MRSTIVSVGAVLLAGKAAAHGLVSSIVIDGVTYQGYPAFNSAGNPQRIIRAMQNNGPIQDVKLAAIACNGDGTNAPAALVAPVTAGSSIEFTWDTWPESHKGPITNYLASCDGDCTTFDQAKAKWFKIDESGFFGNNQWATDKLIANNLKYSLKVPTTVPNGEYLLRHEILALHSTGAPQYYPSCAQVKVTGGASSLAAGTETVSFPGAYSLSDAGAAINIYSPAPTSYEIQGPTVIEGGSSVGNSASGSGSAPAPAPATSAAAPASTSAAAATSVAATSAPVPTSAADEYTTTAADEYTTSVAVPTSVAAEPATSAPAATSAAAPATSAAAETSVAAEPATSAAAPTSTKAAATTAAPATPVAPQPTAVTDANGCWRNYNKCLDASQPHPDFVGCGASRDTCVSSFNVRRSGTLGRRFV